MLNKRPLLSATLVAAAAIIAACTQADAPKLDAGAAAHDASRPSRIGEVVATSTSARPDINTVSRLISDTAVKCWIGRDKRFKGYAAAGPVQTPAGFEMSLQPRKANVVVPDYVIAVLSRGKGQKGFLLQVTRSSATTLPADKINKDLKRLATGRRVC